MCTDVVMLFGWRSVLLACSVLGSISFAPGCAAIDEEETGEDEGALAAQMSVTTIKTKTLYNSMSTEGAGFGQAGRTMKFLVDARKLGPLLREDMEWAAREADPKLHAAGMRKIAFVIPESAIGRTSIKTYQKSAQVITPSPLASRQFSSMEEATRWLKEP